MIFQSDLQPLKSFIFLVSQSVNLRDLISQLMPTVGDEVGQSGIRGLTISAYIMSDGKFKSAITFVRLLLSFSQCSFAVAALGSDQRLPSMSAGSCRLQLRRSMCDGVCLIHFPRV